MFSGNRPTDGRGNLRFTSSEYQQLIEDKPELTRYFRKLIGGNELIQSTFNYVLWLDEDDVENAITNDEIKQRIENVKKARKNNKKLLQVPWRFRDTREPNNSMIVIPATSSENRLYVPMNIYSNDFIANNSTMVIYDAPLWIMGLLQSRLHMVWLRIIGGKLETRLRYSKELVYNTFPIPELSSRRKNEIEEFVWKILDIRDEEGGTLAELYGSPLAEKNPKPMNSRLKAAHEELDQVVDRAYRDRPFKDDNERLSLLLDMYSQKVNEENNAK